MAGTVFVLRLLLLCALPADVVRVGGIADAALQVGDELHIGFFQLKVEHLRVLTDTLGRDGLGQGQVAALKTMLDEPHECAAVLQQIAAIRGAVNGLMREVIKGHLTEHIVHQGDEIKREEDLDVVLKVLDSYIK